MMNPTRRLPNDRRPIDAAGWLVTAALMVSIAAPLAAQDDPEREARWAAMKVEVDMLVAKRRAVETQIEPYLRNVFGSVDFFERRRQVISSQLDIESHAVPLGEPEPVTRSDGSVMNVRLHRLRVSGEGPIDDLRHWFLRMGHRESDYVESLTLRAAADGGLEFSAVVAIAEFHEVDWQPLDGGVVERERQYLDRTLGTLERLRWLGAQPDFRDLGEVLTVVDLTFGGGATRVSEMLYDAGSLRLRGVAAGQQARDRVASALAARGLPIQSIDFIDEAACHRFDLVAGFVELDEDTHYDVADGPSFHPDPRAACLESSSVPIVELAGLGDPADAAFELHLNDVGVVGLFEILYRVGGGSFIVDADLERRLRGALSAPSARAAVETLSGVDFHIGEGPIRRVSSHEPPPRPATPPRPSDDSAQPITVVLSDAGLLDFLCALARMEQAAVYAADGVGGRLRLFGGQMAVAQIIESVLDGAGLTMTMDADRWLVEPADGSVDGVAKIDRCAEPPPAADRFPDFTLDPTTWTTADLRWAAWVRVDDAWRAFAYAPGGQLLELRPDTVLADGEVEAIDAERVTVRDRKTGTVRYVSRVRHGVGAGSGVGSGDSAKR